MNLQNLSHKRYNILTGEWVLVSPNRTERPWLGKIEKFENENLPEYDPSCYLCPGNIRANGEKNPNYTDTFVFINDFSALKLNIDEYYLNKNNLFIAETEKGICKVICFSPKHNLTLSTMKKENIKKVIDVWINEYINLGELKEINYIQIFENHGLMMGCSNPHPHCQLWAQQSVPYVVEKETFFQKKYYENKKRCLLCDYIEAELKEKERVVFQNNSFIVLVPFWAIWPFEVIILPLEHKPSIEFMNEKEKVYLAETLNILGIKYDNLFLTNFPYSMGIHQKPTDKNQHPEWHFHFHYYPPLLRSANIRKFMVGYEMLAMPQRDITPELAAEKLKETPTIHYLSS